MCTIKQLMFFSLVFLISSSVYTQDIDWQNTTEKELREYLDITNDTRADGTPHEVRTYITTKILRVMFFVWKVFIIIYGIISISMICIVTIRERKVYKLIEQGTIIVPTKKGVKNNE